MGSVVALIAPTKEDIDRVASLGGGAAAPAASPAAAVARKSVLLLYSKMIFVLLLLTLLICLSFVLDSLQYRLSRRIQKAR